MSAAIPIITMPDIVRFRRDFTIGGTYFFTVNLADRGSRLLVDHIADLRAAFASVRRRHPFASDAIVVLPEHLHAIWTLPPNDADYPMRWRLIKTTFSRAIAKTERRSASRIAKGERGIWQRRYWEHRVRDQQDFAAHVDYVHINPVKHRHVDRVRDWPWSSFHRFVCAGTLPINWADVPKRFDGSRSFGER